jgi:hypothetical protein
LCLDKDTYINKDIRKDADNNKDNNKDTNKDNVCKDNVCKDNVCKDNVCKDTDADLSNLALRLECPSSHPTSHPSCKLVVPVAYISTSQ